MDLRKPILGFRSYEAKELSKSLWHQRVVPDKRHKIKDTLIKKEALSYE